jgi:AbrB family looped-hinge helix DNA binding protein
MSKKTIQLRKIDLRDKMYGTTTVGARGQVVIPAQARKDLKLKPGDQLVAMGKLDKVVAFMKADQIESLVALIMDQIDENLSKDQIKKQAQEFLKLVKTKKY